MRSTIDFPEPTLITSAKASADYTLTIERDPNGDFMRPWVSTLTRNDDDGGIVFMCRRISRKYAVMSALDHASYDHRETTRSSQTPHVLIVDKSPAND
jgi:hypothetical protein